LRWDEFGVLTDFKETLAQFAAVLEQFATTVERVDVTVERIGVITDEMAEVVGEMAGITQTFAPAFAVNEQFRRQLERIRGGLSGGKPQEEG
jgi:hypothetical protein